MSALDPIVEAIVAADMASLVHTATLVFLDEADEADMERSEAAGRAVDRALEAVQQTAPTTLAGLLTLVRFYARDAKIYCRWDTGGDYLEHVASALEVFVAREAQAPLSLTEAQIREATGIPGQAEIKAAWHALPAETRDRIGIAVVDMVFQEFVSGDAYIATEQFEDLPVYDPDIRAAAMDAANRRLNELPRLVEDALPDLFGKDENPAWSENPGKIPTATARAWAAEARAERAAKRARVDAELEAEDAAA